MQAGQVDLVLNLKGQSQAVQGVSAFQQSVVAMGTRTEQALGGVNRAFNEVGAGASKMATAGTTAAAGLTRTTEAMGQTSRAAKVLSDDLKDAGEGANGLLTTFKGMVAAQFTVTTLQQAAAAAYEFGKASVEAALQSQRITRGLEYATGSATAGAAALAFVRSEADRLGISLPEAAREFTKLAAAARGTSLEGQGVRNIFTGIAEASTVLGLSADETAGALNAIQQMMSKGTVAAEELRGQLGERLYGAFNIASKAMGVSTAELGKMLQQGEVMTSDFLPKLYEGLHTQFGGAAQDAAHSAQAAFNRFGTAMNDLKVSLGQGLLPVLTEMATVATSVIKGVTNLGHSIAESSTPNYVAGYNVIENAIAGVDLKARAAAEAARKLAEEQAKIKPDTNAGITVSDDNDPKMTQERIDQINKIRADADRARLESTKQGFALQQALEDIAYHTNLTKFQGSNALMEAEQARHTAAMHLLKVQQSQADYALLQDSANHREEFARKAQEKDIREENLRRDIAARNEAADEDFFKGKSEFQKQLEILSLSGADREREVSRQKYADLEKQVDDWNLFDGDREAALTQIHKAEAKKRIEIATAEVQARVELGGTMAKNLIEALDTFYGHSRKNALLHKLLAIGTMEIDGAMAAVKAFASAQDLPYPYNLVAGFAAAAAVDIKTKSLEYRASQQHFANSGIVAGDSTYGDRVPVWANSGEMVLNGADQRSLFNMIKSGVGGAGVSNTQGGPAITVHFAPVVNAAAGTDVQSITDALRRERVEFGEFLRQEVIGKGYAR